MNWKLDRNNFKIQDWSRFNWSWGIRILYLPYFRGLEFYWNCKSTKFGFQRKDLVSFEEYQQDKVSYEKLIAQHEESQKYFEQE